mgnify:FL=1
MNEIIILLQLIINLLTHQVLLLQEQQKLLEAQPIIIEKIIKIPTPVIPPTKPEIIIPLEKEINTPPIQNNPHLRYCRPICASS